MEKDIEVAIKNPIDNLKKLVRGGGTITLSGRAIDRSVSISDNGEVLIADVDWGYYCEKSRALSLAILSAYLPAEWANLLHDEFAKTILSILPSTNFTAVIELGAFIDIATKSVEVTRPMRAQQFVSILVKDNFFVPGLIDLPSNYQQTDGFLFEKDALEFWLITQLTLQELEYYKSYINFFGHRKKDPLDVKSEMERLSVSVTNDSILIRWPLTILKTDNMVRGNGVEALEELYYFTGNEFLRSLIPSIPE